MLEVQDQGSSLVGFWWELSLWVVDGCLLDMCACDFFSVWTGKGVWYTCLSSISSHKGTNPIMRTPSPWPGHIPKAPSNVIALEVGASIYKFWEDTLSPLQTHYLYQPVEEKLYIAEAKASKFLNGLKFPSLSITPPILPLLPLLLLLFLLSRPPPPSLTHI